MADSIVDYLSRKGISPTYDNRKRIWKKYYPNEVYRGTYEQNTRLLTTLKRDDSTGTPADIFKQMQEYNPLNIMTTKKSEIKVVPKQVQQYVKNNYKEEVEYESTQTEDEKKAYLKKSQSAIPLFDGEAIQKATKLEAYYNTQKNTAEYEELSDDEKEELEKIYFDRMVEITNEYVVKNLDRFLALYNKLKKLGDGKGIEESGAVVQACVDFLNFYQKEYAEPRLNYAGLGSIVMARMPIMRNMTRFSRAQIEETAGKYSFWKKASGSIWKLVAGGAITYALLKNFIIQSEAKSSYWEKATEGSDKVLERGKEVIDTTQKEPGKRSYKDKDFLE